MYGDIYVEKKTMCVVVVRIDRDKHEGKRGPTNGIPALLVRALSCSRCCSIAPYIRLTL